MEINNIYLPLLKQNLWVKKEFFSCVVIQPTVPVLMFAVFLCCPILSLSVLCHLKTCIRDLSTASSLCHMNLQRWKKKHVLG